MLDDYQLPVSGKSLTAINRFTGLCRMNGLLGAASDVDPFSLGLDEVFDDFPLDRSFKVQL